MNNQNSMSEPLTLRKLIEMVGPDFMDTPLSVNIIDPHLNNAWCPAPTRLEQMPREAANPRTGELGRLSLTVRLAGARLVKIKKQ